ncbi:exostosin family-domain-containing protein [Fimicolochytrium jonesii]|uniref:exostosin family-domain-containing protein n=1 Tax=Fimicolochytrium jonesii TaxID=1396493 RepID=UPI0022FE575D|nr:exostosin family-domain-containing protein [Fimicolochytrium jonesii]KAI8816572.1 exostosin family-domain-containing protein [Fimicolochytrium jonesii]
MSRLCRCAASLKGYLPVIGGFTIMTVFFTLLLTLFAQRPEKLLRILPGSVADHFNRTDKAADTRPFEEFECLGDEITSNGYRRGFRFHVYDVPMELYQPVLDRNPPYLDPNDGESHHSAEVYIWKYLKLHPCHTSKRSEADAFVVPVLGIGSNMWGPSDHSDKVFKWVAQQPEAEIFKGHDHYALGEGALANLRSLMPNINYITPEIWSLPVGLTGTDERLLDGEVFRRERNSIIISYPDPRFANMGEAEVKEHISNHDKLAVWIGTIPANAAAIRQAVLDQMADRNARHNDTLAVLMTERRKISDVPAVNDRGVFGPSTAGDIRTARRSFSLLMGGTIPVMICDLCILPYEDFVDWESVAIFIPESKIFEPGYNFVDELAKIPQSRIKEMQEAMLRVRRHFIWHDGPSQPGDAMDMMVRQLARDAVALRRFKRFAVDAFARRQHKPAPM